ncbi:MAG: hypothetical protein JXK94_01855 [Deltaproteobacteria bacterium]|nr:hypothetical protein [Deltaproteobacteria bacterium]
MLKLQDGLNVIRAEKSAGKTTVLNAILYALGLEKMLDREGTSILKPVLKREVFFEGEIHSVLESFVELEIRNSSNQFLTLKRQIIGESDTDTISVFHGAKLSNPRDQFYQEHLYELGCQEENEKINSFHGMLAAFLNWKLPLVGNYQGSENLLPLECIFSFIFVDQMQGWDFDPNRFTAFLGLQQPRQAAFEFIFNLDVGAISRKKRKLTEAIGELKNQWADLEDFFQSMAGEVGGKVHNFPHKPTISYDPYTPPMVMIARHQNWISIEKLVSSLKEEFSKQEGTEREYAEPQMDATLETEIALLEKKYAVEQIALAELRDNFFDERENIKFLQEKVRGLEKELGKLEKQLEEKETEVELDSVFPDKFGLLGEKRGVSQGTQNSAASIFYSIKNKREKIEKQKLAAVILLEAAESNLDETGRNFEQKNLKVSELRKRIKHLKKDSPPVKQVPPGEIKDVLLKKEKIREFESLIGKIDQKTAEISRLSKRWKELLAEQANIRKEYHSPEDKRKLKKFLSLMIDNARSFGFSSGDPGKMKLSLETYRPGLEGLDIQHDFSASDIVRLTWAFVIALQQTAAFFPCNNPQICFFDEPSQQNVRFEDKKAFYSRLIDLELLDNQVLVATSETPDAMEQFLDAKKVNYIDFKENIIAPLDV